MRACVEFNLFFVWSSSFDMKQEFSAEIWHFYFDLYPTLILLLKCSYFAVFQIRPDLFNPSILITRTGFISYIISFEYLHVIFDFIIKENSISNSSNAQYYFRGSVKCVTSSSLEIRWLLGSLTFPLNYWTIEKFNTILN